MTRYVVDASAVLAVIERDITLASRHDFVAPALVRSDVVNELYTMVRRGDLDIEEGSSRLTRFSTMRIRYLGDAVLRRRAWSVAEELGLDSTFPAEYIALTQLQGDVFVTADEHLARIASGVVAVAGIDELA